MSVHSVHSHHSDVGSVQSHHSDVRPVSPGHSSASTIVPAPSSGQDCLEQLWTKVTSVFKSFIEGVQKCVNKVLVCLGFRVAPGAETDSALTALLKVLTAVKTPFEQLLIIKEMYECEGSEEEHVEVLTKAMESLPPSTSRLIYFTHYNLHHEEADWVDAPNAGQLHFLENIASDQTLCSVLEHLPAYSMMMARKLLEDVVSEPRTLLLAIEEVQSIEIPTEDWMLEVEKTTAEQRDSLVRELCTAVFGEEVFVDISFAEGEPVSDAAHKAFITNRIEALDDAVSVRSVASST